MSPPRALSLPEEFLLFLCDHASGPGEARLRGLDTDVAKARLVELALRDRVALDGRGRLIATDPSPTGDALLDPAIVDLVRNPRSAPFEAPPRTCHGCARAYLERLERAALIRSEQAFTRFLKRPVTRYSVSASATLPINQRVAKALGSPAQVDARDLALLLLLVNTLQAYPAVRAVMPVADGLGFFEDVRRRTNLVKAARASGSETIVTIAESHEPS
jgi:hypothetical protein